MRVDAGLLWATFALEASLASSQALVYTSETGISSSKSDPRTLCPVTARLLLAHRLGLSQYHSLEANDYSNLDILNAHGGYQTSIFDEEDHIGPKEKLLVVVEGVSNAKDVFDPSINPTLSMQDPPSPSHNAELLSVLLEQDQHSRGWERRPSLKQLDFPGVRGGISMQHVSPDKSRLFNSVLPSTKPQLSDIMDLREKIGMVGHDNTMILHISTLQGLKPENNERYTTALTDLKAFINYFYKQNTRISSTIILMPPSPKTAKRSLSSPYGTFTKPLSARQQQAEEPLSPNPSTSPSTQNPSSPSLLQASTSPLPHGPIPICHPTLDSANLATNNCSGHGTAYKKAAGETDCYACKCEKTVLEVEGGGTKTVYWGGSACQKKDISVPFFLLAGLSIALVGAVTWGVGLLVSIGQEQLPSVIGAGVTGPRAQK